MSKDLGYVKYHTKICNAIRSRYVECGKRKQEIHVQLIELGTKLSRFMDGKENLTYKEYTNIKSTIDQLHHEEEELNIQIAVWDEAREICLNIIYDTDED